MLNDVSAKRNGGQNRSKSILILDEDGQNSRNLKQSLKSSGYRIELRHSVSDFRIAQLDLAGFDLVVCDIDNGLGVWKFLLDRIHSRKLFTQLILISRKSRQSEWYEALQLGVFDFVIKPYSAVEVSRIVSSAFLINYSERFQIA